MTTPKALEDYIASQYGDTASVMVRDPDSSFGWRHWTLEDSQSLSNWLAAERDPNGAPAPRPKRICHNLEEAARIAGVGRQAIRSWIERKTNPLPHIRDGRRILIPHSELVCWIRDEARRETSCPDARARNGHRP